MTIADTRSIPADGYWTVQVVTRDPGQIGRRYLCRAQDDLQVKAMAGHLAGAARGVVGYDYRRIDPSRALQAPSLSIGQSVSIEGADLWATLREPGPAQ